MDRAEKTRYEKALAELAVLYREVDAEIGSRNLPCGSKCSACCHFSVNLTALEAKLILPYLKTLDGRKATTVAANIQKWFQSCQSDKILDDCFKRSDLRGIADRTFQAKIPCPLLLEDKCAIYPVRPLVCRAYYHVDGPDACEAGATDATFADYFCTIEQKIQTIHAKNHIPCDYTVLSLECVKLLPR